jgi:DNA-binding ferritin-like protein (Dps family)
MAPKWIGDKRRYRAVKRRIEALPPAYRITAEALQRYSYYFGGATADGGMKMLEDLADLFEQGAAVGTPIRDIIGDDPVEFANEFLSNYPNDTWMVRERQRLVTAIQTAESEPTTN